MVIFHWWQAVLFNKNQYYFALSICFHAYVFVWGGWIYSVWLWLIEAREEQRIVLDWFYYILGSTHDRIQSCQVLSVSKGLKMFPGTQGCVLNDFRCSSRGLANECLKKYHPKSRCQNTFAPSWISRGCEPYQSGFWRQVGKLSKHGWPRQADK